MQVKCPACNATFSLEAALAIDAGRSALLVALQMPAPLGQLLAMYLGMFRAAGRALAFSRAESLLLELKPMLDNNMVERNGIKRACPLALWQQGLERMVEHRNVGKLQLPLKTHGYLLEIVFALADAADAQQEKSVEKSRRSGVAGNASAPSQGDQQMARLRAISRARGDLEMGLITREQAETQLRDAGINPEVLDK